MKQFLYRFSILALLGGMFFGCQEDFLDTFPTTAVSADAALESTKNAYAALNGIHRIMYAQFPNAAQGQAGEGSNNLFRDYLGEDIVFPRAGGSTAYAGVMQWQSHRNVNDGTVSYMYRFYYRIIANANVLINGIDDVPGLEADRKIIKGQALAYRAWSYFQLIQLWGKRYDANAKPNSSLGVPLLLENTLEGQPRATVEEVYTQINKDLDEAITLLAGYNRVGSAAKSNINVNVAQGFKARIALTQQDWATAATAAVAARQGFPLMDTTAYKAGFNNINNVEWIWGNRQIDDHNTFFWSYFAYNSANFNSTVLRTQPRAINSTLWNAIPNSDIRKKMWDRTGANVPIPPGGARVPFQNQKFLAQSSSSSVGDVVLMRAAEMLLIEAEAKARLNDEAGARQALFTLVRARDPRYVLSTNSGAALINEILFNRRIELWGEGFRFTDLKRLNLPLDRRGISNHILAIIAITEVPAGDIRWEWLFPQDELNTNKQIVQNPI